VPDAIRAANTEFYRAFESLSLDAMEAVWAQTDDVRCVHPGWQEMCGWDAVRKSWKAIFEAAAYMEFNVTNLALWTSNDLACVFCHENIVTFREGHEVRTVVLATNVFRRQNDRWLMIVHHGSPVLSQPEIE
jgi:ketosteroid isomerase-like protein